jgi:hypothetical protein
MLRFGLRCTPRSCTERRDAHAALKLLKRTPSLRALLPASCAGRRCLAARCSAAAAEPEGLEAQVLSALSEERDCGALTELERADLVLASCVLLGALQHGHGADDDGDSAQLLASDVVRGLLRWQSLCGLLPRDAARLALNAPDMLTVPPSRIVAMVLLFRRLFPDADLRRIFETLPAHVLLSDIDALEHCALGALCELRMMLLPEVVVQLLAQEEPALFFGGLSLERVDALRDAWAESGLEQLSEEQLARDMRNERWTQYFRNRFIMYG